jgi:hypothetical protein
MEYVGQSSLKNHTDMFVIQGIEHLATIAARFYQIRRTQNAQLVAHHRLFQIQAFRDIVHSELSR